MTKWTPEFRKAYMKAYRQTPEAKAHRKAYEQSEFRKAYMKAYYQREAENDNTPAEIKYQRTIARIRKKYELLCLKNPALAKIIKDDMEQEEGVSFRKLAIDGIWEKQMIMK